MPHLAALTKIKYRYSSCMPAASTATVPFAAHEPAASRPQLSVHARAAISPRSHRAMHRSSLKGPELHLLVEAGRTLTRGQRRRRSGREAGAGLYAQLLLCDNVM